MNEALRDKVKARLESKEDVKLIEQGLIEQGFLEEDINEVLHDVAGDMQIDKKQFHKKISRKFLTKELFDRAGYGFGSQQYVNILFYQCGASIPIIGLTNGFRAIMSALLSSFAPSERLQGSA